MRGPALSRMWHPATGHQRVWLPRDQAGIQCFWDLNKASSINAGTPLDGDLVTNVADQLGLAALTSTSAWAPVWKTNQRGGRSCARYTEAQVNLTLRTGAGAITNGAFSTILIVDPSSLNVARTLWTAADGVGTSFLSTANTPSVRVQIDGVTDDRGLGVSWMTQAFHMIISTYDGTNAGNITRQDRALLTASDIAATDPGVAAKARQWFIGSTAGIASPFQGDLYCAAVVNKALSAAECNRWFNWGKHDYPGLS